MEEINWLDFPTVKCGTCGKGLWQEVYAIKNIIVNPQSKGINTIKILICNNCKTVHPEYNNILQNQIGPV